MVQLPAAETAGRLHATLRTAVNRALVLAEAVIAEAARTWSARTPTCARRSRRSTGSTKSSATAPRYARRSIASRSCRARTALCCCSARPAPEELFARAIHDRSPRRQRPLVRVNCAALPSTLIESELFGPERGAFTGAVSMRQGRFELADKGTIFLDEIGDLPLDLEAKLVPLPSPSAHVAAADRAHSGPGHADAPGPRLA